MTTRNTKSTEKIILPVILSLPHGGLELPREVADNVAVGPSAIYNDCDLSADALFEFGQECAVLATVSTPIARALVDVNRYPDDLDNPDGPVKTQTSYGSDIYHTPLPVATQQILLERYWRDFHDRLDQALETHGAQVKLLLDCHNMAQRGPAAYHDPGAIRPLICLANLGDARGEPLASRGLVSCDPALLRSAGQLAEGLFADMTLLEASDASPPPVVALNAPFYGGYILARHAAEMRSRGLPPAIMVEANRGLFVGDQNADSQIMPPNRACIDQIRARLLLWLEQVLSLV